MIDEKFFLKSKTIIGAVLTFLVVLLPNMGINFTADDSALVSNLADQIIVAATTGLTVYGRFTANTKVKV